VFGWEPGIGDPTFYGWATVAAYAFGGLCCWWASRRGPSSERRFWRLLAVAMGFLCVNKQLDLQTLFTDAARFEAKAHGWYGQRREYQVAFIAAVALVAGLAVVAMLWRAREATGPVKGAIVGFALLLLFVVVRASSFNKVDWLISQRLGGMRANHVMELGGIAIVMAFALLAGRRRSRSR
jgi:hypothetical protein